MADPIQPRKPPKWLRAALVAALVAGFLAVLFFRDSIDAEAIADWAQKQSVWATALEFLIVHIVVGLFFVPRVFMGLAAGALFGPWLGSVLSLAGGVLGAFVGFFVVRFINAGTVRLREAPRIGQWLEKAEAQGWRLVFIVRLIPVLPHTLVNYVFGLSRISLGGYLAGSTLGMLPTAIVYANLGSNGRSVAEGAQNYALLAAWGLGLIFVSWLLPKVVARLFPHIGG